MTQAKPPRRRRLLQLAALPLLPAVSAVSAASAAAPVASAGAGATAAPAVLRPRVRPGAPGWPSAAAWQGLAARLSPGALLEVRSPWPQCVRAPSSPACTQLFKRAKNPYYLGDEVALTQTLGYVDAWTSAPSVWAVAARNAQDVAAAVGFAREHGLRLAVKGGGHSYQGTSNAPDSLLLWTRRMDSVQLHEAFVPQGCNVAPSHAVSVGAGALWGRVYDAVTTRGGRYVQGGGCMTVGVAGLVQSGGFGSFSKAFGLAASHLLEAEVVTADGQVRIANACREPELFWALQGGGGGSFGVVTRLTLRTHPLPATFGAVNFTVRARSEAAYRRLVDRTLAFYQAQLMNAHWGEQIRLRRGHVLEVSMVFQGLERSQAQAVWDPFLDAVAAAGDDYAIDFAPLKVVATAARTFWSPSLFKKMLGFMVADGRPDAPPENVYWAGDEGQAGQVLHGYQSTWLPADLLQEGRRPALVDALVASAAHWGVSLHFNKGLAGASPEVRAAARATAMNPAVADAFALAISGAGGPPAYPGVAGHAPDVAGGRVRAQAVARVKAELRRLVPEGGAYVSESDYFEAGWQQAFWGGNYRRLLAAKAQYDPQGLFFVHHGVGSERWSADGFTPRG